MDFQATSTKYRHIPDEVYALRLDGGKGDSLDLCDFPVTVTVMPTGKTLTDGIFGPIPSYDVEWVDPATREIRKALISDKDMIIAKPHVDHGVWISPHKGKYFLEFEDMDTFLGRYKPVGPEDDA